MKKIQFKYYLHELPLRDRIADTLSHLRWRFQ